MARINTVDFDKARKKRQRKQNTKRALVLGGLAAGVALLILVNNFLVEEGVTTRISDLISSYGGSGYPIDLPGGVIRDVKNIGSDLVVLNDTNLYIYTEKGKQISNVQQMGATTVLLAGDNRLMTYDPGVNRYIIHSRGKTLLEKDNLDYGMFTADINARGDYVVVTGSKQTACEVRAYNKKYEEIYICYFTQQISAVSVAPKGTAMAAGYISAQDGVLVSGVKLYRFSSREEQAHAVFPDEMLLSLSYYGDDRVGVLTDRAYRILNNMGAIQAEYSLADYTIYGMERSGDQVLLLCETMETRLRKVILLDGLGEEVAFWSTEEKVADMALGPRAAYVLTEAGIYSFGAGLALENLAPMRFVSDLHLVGDRLYYMTQSEICVLGQEEEPDKLRLGDDEEELPEAESETAQPSRRDKLKLEEPSEEQSPEEEEA